MSFRPKPLLHLLGRYATKVPYVRGVKRLRNPLGRRVRELHFEEESRRIVYALSETYGVRHIHSNKEYNNLDAAFLWLNNELLSYGYHDLDIQTFISRHREVSNLIAEVPGHLFPKEIILIGAHYDTSPTSPGANDNASGVAAILCLARYFHDHPQARTLRFALFVNEEPPLFRSNDMGSVQYARQCLNRDDKIVLMITPDTVGYYVDKLTSHYLIDLASEIGVSLPTFANFLAVVGDESISSLIHFVANAFNNAEFPTVAVPMPPEAPGASWSDHSSFLQAGFPALMLTDSALYRYAHYHTPSDTHDKLTYRPMAKAIEAFRVTLEELANMDNLPT